jgi:hypothetical protein
MKKIKRKYKLTDFLPKEVVDEFIELKNNPELKEAMEEAEEEIGERLKDLYEFIGRELTRPERRRVLEIVEKYSPRDEDGDYWSLETLLPFEHAWVIYEEELERKKEILMDLVANPKKRKPKK